MTENLLKEYTSRYEAVLSPIARKLSQLIEGHLRGVGFRHVERVTARPKTPDSFVEKAAREEYGKRKYTDPLSQIQDQIGVRIIVLYVSDVTPTRDTILRYFRAIEERELVPESESAFGYFGHHFVLAVPPDAIPKKLRVELAPKFFELQIKTLFQHAWSEANHDLAYRPVEDLTDNQKRRVAFTAAQAWGADLMLDQLAAELA